MTDGLDMVEQRIQGLIAQFRDAKQQIRELEGRIQDKTDQADRLERENEALRERLGGLESELASRAEREELARRKLKQIVGQIDSLESEIAEIEAVAHGS
jgi:chromosome segregation ATPase